MDTTRRLFSRLALHPVHPPVLLRYPGWDQGQKFSTTLMQGKTIRWCSNVSSGVVQVASASIVPRTEIQVFSEVPDKRAI